MSNLFKVASMLLNAISRLKKLMGQNHMQILLIYLFQFKLFATLSEAVLWRCS